MFESVSVDLHGTSFRYEQAHPARGAGCALDHLHPSVKRRERVGSRRVMNVQADVLYVL